MTAGDKNEPINGGECEKCREHIFDRLDTDTTRLNEHSANMKQLTAVTVQQAELMRELKDIQKDQGDILKGVIARVEVVEKAQAAAEATQKAQAEAAATQQAQTATATKSGEKWWQSKLGIRLGTAVAIILVIVVAAAFIRTAYLDFMAEVAKAIVK